MAALEATDQKILWADQHYTQGLLESSFRSWKVFVERRKYRKVHLFIQEKVCIDTYRMYNKFFREGN